MVFDRTWKRLKGQDSDTAAGDAFVDRVFEAMADHPFLISSPEMARQVAAFRIRLLDLN